MGRAGDEVLIEQRFINHHMDHGEADCGIGAGLRPQPQVGDTDGRDPLRIDDDDLPAALLQLFKCDPFYRVGFVGIAAHHQRTARVVDILAARDVESGRAQAHRAATAAEILVDHPVWRAEGTQQHHHGEAAPEIDVVAGAYERQRAVLLAHRGETIGGVIERLVP